MSESSENGLNNENQGKNLPLPHWQVVSKIKNAVLRKSPDPTFSFSNRLPSELNFKFNENNKSTLSKENSEANTNDINTPQLRNLSSPTLGILPENKDENLQENNDQKIENKTPTKSPQLCIKIFESVQKILARQILNSINFIKNLQISENLLENKPKDIDNFEKLIDQTQEKIINENTENLQKTELENPGLIKNSFLSENLGKPNPTIELLKPENKKCSQENLLLKDPIWEKYLSHCALFIQKNFRRYGVQKKYGKLLKKSIRLMQLRKALIKAWKIRKIMKLRKISGNIKMIRNLQNSVYSLQNSNDQYSKNMCMIIKSQLSNKIADLQRLIHILYLTGDWTNEKNYIKDSPVKKFVIQKKIINDNLQNPKHNSEISKPIENNSEIISKIRSKSKSRVESPKPILSHKMFASPQNEDYDNRPIKPLGQDLLKNYEMDESVKNEFESGKVKKKPKREFLKRKEVYDPKKAIENAQLNKKLANIKKITPEIQNRNNFIIRNEYKTNEEKFSGIMQNNEEEIMEQKIQRVISPKPYLKRKSKKVEISKLDWKRVAKRVDCWNPQTKMQKIAYDKKQKNNIPYKTKLNEKSKNFSTEKITNRQKQTKQKDIKKSTHIQIDLTKIQEKLSARELLVLFNQYHGENSIQKNITESKIPILKKKSRFYVNYQDENYEVFFYFFIY